MNDVHDQEKLVKHDGMCSKLSQPSLIFLITENIQQHRKRLQQHKEWLRKQRESISKAINDFGAFF